MDRQTCCCSLLVYLQLCVASGFSVFIGFPSGHVALYRVSFMPALRLGYQVGRRSGTANLTIVATYITSFAHFSRVFRVI